MVKARPSASATSSADDLENDVRALHGAALNRRRIDAYLLYCERRGFDEERRAVARADLATFCDMLGEADVTTLSTLEIQARTHALQGFSTPPAVVQRMRDTVVVFVKFCRDAACDLAMQQLARRETAASEAAAVAKKTAAKHAARQAKQARKQPKLEADDVQPRVLTQLGATLRDGWRLGLWLGGCVASLWLIMTLAGSLFWVFGWVGYLASLAALGARAVRAGLGDDQRVVLQDRDYGPFVAVAGLGAPAFFFAHLGDVSDVEGNLVNTLLSALLLVPLPLAVLVSQQGVGGINSIYPPNWWRVGRRIPGDAVVLLGAGTVYAMVSVIGWTLSGAVGSSGGPNEWIRVGAGVLGAWVFAATCVLVGATLRGHARLFGLRKATFGVGAPASHASAEHAGQPKADEGAQGGADGADQDPR